MTANVLALLDERCILGLTIYGEARGEPIEGKIGVANVVRNRVRRKARFGESFRVVCLAEKQFSCWNDADPNRPLLLKLAAQLREDPFPTDPVLRECLAVASLVITHQFQDNTHGADHYLTAAQFATDPPKWARTYPQVARRGIHLFFKEPVAA